MIEYTGANLMAVAAVVIGESLLSVNRPWKERILGGAVGAAAKTGF